MSDELPPECEAFAAVVNAVLDGDAPAAGLASAHAQACRDCRQLAAAARLLAAAGPALRSQPAMPADLRPRLVTSMVRTRRRQRWGPALAACMAVVSGMWLTWPTRPAPVAVVVPAPAAPRVADQWAAVASVARTASEKATASARMLAAPDVRLATPAPLRPTADALATLERASKATAEPVAGTARRAVGLFMRDFGLSAKPAG